MDQPSELSIGQSATLACCLEVSIPKPGNVHRGADFPNMNFHDFLISAVAIGPVMDCAHELPLGEVVFRCVEATRSLVGVNTNLGTVLLLAPLAKAHELSPEAVGQCIDQSGQEDCVRIYEAIRLADPGGMAKVDAHDIAGPAPDRVVDAMREAADRDLIASQYVNGFQDVFGFVLPQIEGGLDRGWSLTDAVIHAHLMTMHEYPDSLIARKIGLDLAEQAAALAGHVLAAGGPGEESYLRELSEFDFWLRADGNRRNPGTTADMIAAGLFVGLRRGTIRFPLSVTANSFP